MNSDSKFLSKDSPKNAAGQTEAEFLTAYDASRYERPSVTCDAAVFLDGKILLIRRGNHPFLGFWALPGGFLNPDETAEQCATRELCEETNQQIPLRQAFAVSTPNRDPRCRTLTICFTNLPLPATSASTPTSLQQKTNQIPTNQATIPNSKNPTQSTMAGDDAADAGWFDIAVFGEGEFFELRLKKGDILLNASLQVARDDFGQIDLSKTICLQSRGLAFDHPQIILKLLLDAN